MRGVGEGGWLGGASRSYRVYSVAGDLDSFTCVRVMNSLHLSFWEVFSLCILLLLLLVPSAGPPARPRLSSTL